MASKRTGRIGPIRVHGDAQTGISVDYIDPDLPTNKEALEKVFARCFVDLFNTNASDCRSIKILSQGDTSDLDFSIEHWRASYLELAEITPLSEPFGKEAARTGRLDILEYATWIYDNIVRSKGEKYGHTAHKTILLLYSTYPEFHYSDSLAACLRSLCFWRGSKFDSVWLFRTPLGPDFGGEAEEVTWMTAGIPLPQKPETFAGRHYFNISPENVRIGGVAPSGL